MRKFVLSASIAVLLAGAGSANAGIYIVGNLTSMGGDGYDSVISFPASSFSDVFTFNISSGDNTFSGAASKLSLKSTQLIDTFAANLTGPASFSQAWTYSNISARGAQVQVLSYDGLLPSGSYELTLTGNPHNYKAGNYEILLSASAPVVIETAPIPEPETYALLLAGLGLMGTIVRRRSKSTD